MKFSEFKNSVIDKSRLVILSAQSGESNLLGKSLVRNDETPAAEVASSFWTSQSLWNHLAPLQLRRACELSKCKHFFSERELLLLCVDWSGCKLKLHSWGSRVVKLLCEFKEVLLLVIAALISWRRRSLLRNFNAHLTGEGNLLQLSSNMINREIVYSTNAIAIYS